jgi:hypothetical protein
MLKMHNILNLFETNKVLRGKFIALKDLCQKFKKESEISLSKIILRS